MKILIVILFNLSFFISLPLSAQSSFKNKDKRASLVNVAKVQYFNIAEKTKSIGRLVAVNPTIIQNEKKVVVKDYFKRKEIKDRNGILLAKNIKVDSFYAHPSEIIDKELSKKESSDMWEATYQEFLVSPPILSAVE